MSRKRNKSCLIISCEFNLLVLSYILFFMPNCRCLEREAILLKASPATVKFLHIPYRSLFDRGSSNYRHRFKSIQHIPSKGPIIGEYLRIEPSDAIDDPKYSQPALGYHGKNIYSDSMPSKTTFKDRHLPHSAHNPSHSIFQEEMLPLRKVLQNSSPSKDLRFLERGANMNTHLSEGISEPKNNIQDNKLNDSRVEKLNDVSPNTMLLESNVTESIPHLLSSSSDNVLMYENPSISFDSDGYKYIVPSKKSSERAVEDVPSHYSDNPKSIYSNSNLSTLSSVVHDAITHPPFVLHSHIFNEVVNQTESAESSETTVVPSTYDVENISSSSISFPSDNSKLSPGTVAGIVIGVLVCATLLSSTVIYLLYQKYNGKCTSVVEGKFNSDNCGYLDDSLRSSIYLNNHIELPKESSEEMSSLDNDSFLNSLETMTIQNYWTDSSKNTKV